MAISLVAISGTLYTPSGVVPTAARLTAKLSQPGSTLDGAISVRVASETSADLATGVLTMSLVPNDAITPSGTYYVVTHIATLPNGRRVQWVENWQLASTPNPINIGAVPRLNVIPGVALGVAVSGGDLSGGSATATSGPTKTMAEWTATGPVSVSASQIRATGSTTDRTAGARAADVVNVKDFGAVCNGTDDDTTPVQAAVTYALSFPRAKSLLVPGRCRLTAPISVDRLVDNTLSEFRIIGVGDGAGFYVNSAVNMFSVSAAFEIAHPSTSGPTSEWVSFEGIQFEASSAALAAYVLAPNKFLRMKFTNCNFRYIKLVNSTTYGQTFHFDACNIRYWSGVFATFAGSYDVVFRGSVIEFGESILFSVDPTGVQSTSGLRVIGNLIESMTGTSFKIKSGRGISVSGNYFEASSSGTAYFPLDFNTGGLTHLGIHISGNFCTAASGWMVQLGSGAFNSSGNFASPGLWANGDGAAYVSSVDDHAGATRWLASPTYGFEVRGVDGKLRVGLDGIDALVAQALSIGAATATQINLGHVGAPTRITGRFSPSNDAQASQTGTIYQGSGVPADANGNNGDIYFRTDAPGTASQIIYTRSGGLWRAYGPRVSPDRGDISDTLIVGTQQIQHWATTLTANRTVTLSTTGATNGDTFRVVRTGLGAFTLDVGGLKTIPSATAAFVDVAFNGTAWVLTGYGTL